MLTHPGLQQIATATARHTGVYLLLLAVHGRHLDHSVQRLGQLAPLGRQLAAVSTAHTKVEK